ncbi:hypothetical protein Lser_V15G32177 [Lactuca serriola]
MTTTHYTAEHIPATVDSVVSSPRSDHPSVDNSRVYDDTTAQARVRFMCSFGGKILPRPHDNQLRYVGGDTRMVTVLRHNTTFSSLLNKLSKLSGTTDISVKYQLPNEDLDALISVTGDEDVENMMDEYDRLAHNQKTSRLRIFLFPTDASLSRASSISSLLDGSVKREHWFLDALNGGSALERGRSEVSSIISEVPDYLFGLDHPDDPKSKTKTLVNDNVSVSDPGSPAPRFSSPYCSTSSSLGPTVAPPVPNLRPVRTKLDNTGPQGPMGPVVSEVKETATGQFVEGNDPIILKQTDYAGQPVYYIRQTNSPAPTPTPISEMPMYYMHPPSPMGQENVQARAQYGQQFMGPSGQFLHPNMGQMYPGMRPISGGESYDMSGRSGGAPSQPIYYGARYVPGYPGMVLPGSEEMKQPGSAGNMSRTGSTGNMSRAPQ